MSGFLSNNLYLLIAFLSVLWSVFSTFHDPNIEKTEYEFAQKDNLLKTKDINEVELRQFPKYRLEIDSKIRRSATGTAFYIGDNKWLRIILDRVLWLMEILSQQHYLTMNITN